MDTLERELLRFIHAESDVVETANFALDILQDGNFAQKEAKSNQGTPTNKKSFVCNLDGCNSTFYSPATSARHQKTTKKHRGARNRINKHKCPYCDWWGKSASRLEAHVSIHTGRKNYVCPVDDCNEAFGSDELLMGHQKRVHAHKPFKCNLDGCDSTFAEQSQLTDHQTTAKRHQGQMRNMNRPPIEKPYHCPECKWSGASEDALEIHARKHTGERPFKCHIKDCGGAFPSKSRLNQHLKGENHKRLAMLEEESLQNSNNSVSTLGMRSRVMPFIIDMRLIQMD
jgi:uncharacterized Zn-finger protein